MSVKLIGAQKPPHGVGKHSSFLDYNSNIRKSIIPEPGVKQVIILPQLFQWITVSLAPKDGGSATLFRTISSPDLVLSDSAIWHEWDHGRITTPNFYDYENPWSAFYVDCDKPTLFELVVKAY